jgi:hypothetical protein
MFRAQMFHELTTETSDIEQATPRVARDVPRHGSQPVVHVPQSFRGRLGRPVKVIVIVPVNVGFDGPRIDADEAAAPAPHDTELGQVGREPVVAATEELSGSRRRAQAARVVFPPDRIRSS